MSSTDDIVKKDLEFLTKTLGRFLDFRHWGFDTVHVNVKGTIYGLLYISEKCKVQFSAFRERSYAEPEVHVAYGRLHAQDEQASIDWQGEKCWCWHDVRHLISYLDGKNSKDMSEQDFWLPNIYKKFLEARKVGWGDEEFVARFHSATWDKYGQRLFDLLDVRYPDLWKGYSDFLTEYYQIKEEKYKAQRTTLYPIDPPSYKVC
jgi:hypothetical protein